MTDLLHLLHLGRTPYPRALTLQERLMELRRTGEIADTLVLLEHPPVLTLGRHSGRANVLASDAELLRRGVTLHETKRGGDVTYHGPGQLVGYPILDLRNPDLRAHRMASGARMGVVDFVRLMEEALIRAAGEYGVRTGRVPGRTGVWTLPGGSMPERKLAAIGVHVSRGITSHGFALNVTTDLRDFELIVPCGIADRAVTSIEQEVGEPVPLSQAADRAAKHFGRVFGMQVLAIDTPSELHPSLGDW